jgi:Flp pilus assembly pilin Flp
LIPTVGTYVVYAVSLGIVLFQLVYTVRLLKVVHNFSTGKAVAAVFAPVILLLVPICLIAALTVMGPMVGSVFSSINASLGTPAP